MPGQPPSRIRISSRYIYCMKMCQTHWDQLKQAIHARGAGGMITDSKGLTKSIEAELAGKPPTQKSYDPLFAAHNMIVSNALEVGGLYLMGQDPEGKEYCPLCEVAKHGFVDWIEKAADG